MAEDSKKEADDPTISGDLEKAAEARFQAQCFLLRNISSTTLRNPSRKYSEFAIVSGAPNKVMNALTSRGGAGVLMSLTSADMAQLTPFIRLYKVTQKHEYLFPFSQGSFVDNRLGDYKTKDIFKHRGARGADAGIESVDFEFLATNPAEVTNHIRCTVNLYFRNLSALREKINVPSVKGSNVTNIQYADLILRPNSSASGDDVSKKKVKCGKAGKYDPADYRIKLEVGWNKKTLGAAFQSGLKAEDPTRPGTMIPREQAIKKALEKTELSLQLTLKKHTFKFNPDGSVGLEIEYHAWAEGSLSAPESNLFYLNAQQAKQIAQLEAAKTFRQRQLSDGQEAEKAGEGNFSDDDSSLNPFSDSSSENIQQDIETIDEKINQIRKAQAANSYQRFMQGLMGGSPRDAKIYKLTIPGYVIGAGIEGDITASGKATGEVDAETGGFNLSETGPEADQLKRRLSQQWNRRQCRQLKFERGKAIGSMSKGPAISARRATDPKYSGDSLLQSMREIASKMRTGEGEGMSLYDTAEEEAQDLLEKLTPGYSRDASGDDVDINFFFLGDLINVALQILKRNDCWKSSPASDMTILTGPISFPHPCAKEDIVDMNIADIPISLSLFTGWFIKKIISKQRTTYLLRNFINDVIGELVAPALGEQCTAGTGKVDATVSSQVYTVRTNQYERGTLRSKPVPPLKPGMRYNGEAIFKVINKHGIIKGQKGNPIKDFPYVFLYSSAASAMSLRCKRHDDEAKRGIYHFDFGRSNGTIYKMDFEKNDAPYLGEAKVTGKNNIAADLGGGGIYNVTIEMFGNSVFWPGQYIYVNPGSFGISGVNGCPEPGLRESDQATAYLIRMGGYYIITKVEGTLSRGQYTTKVTARFESAGGPKSKSASQATRDNNAYALYKDKPEEAEEIRRGLALAGADQYDVNPE